jgi:hypothetical protein
MTTEGDEHDDGDQSAHRVAALTRPAFGISFIAC